MNKAGRVFSTSDVSQAMRMAQVAWTRVLVPIITCKTFRVLLGLTSSLQMIIQCRFHSKTLCSNFWVIHTRSWVARTDKDEVCHLRQNRNLFKAASFMKQTWTVTSHCAKVTMLIHPQLHLLKLSLFLLQHTYLIILFVNLYIFNCPCKTWLFLLPV